MLSKPITIYIDENGLVNVYIPYRDLCIPLIVGFAHAETFKQNFFENQRTSVLSMLIQFLD